MGYFEMLFGYEWEKVKSPAGAWQWIPKNIAEKDKAPAAHNPSKRVSPIMTTADLSLRFADRLTYFILHIQHRLNGVMPVEYGFYYIVLRHKISPALHHDYC